MTKKCRQILPLLVRAESIASPAVSPVIQSGVNCQHCPWTMQCMLTHTLLGCICMHILQPCLLLACSVHRFPSLLCSFCMLGRCWFSTWEAWVRQSGITQAVCILACGMLACAVLPIPAAAAGVAGLWSRRQLD